MESDLVSVQGLEPLGSCFSLNLMVQTPCLGMWDQFLRPDSMPLLCGEHLGSETGLPQRQRVSLKASHPSTKKWGRCICFIILTKLVCQSASEEPGKGKCWKHLCRAEVVSGRGSGEQASLNGLANCVTGGVFRCQLSCDSQQLSPSNRACGVPSSAGMGSWDRGCLERTRQPEVEGMAPEACSSKLFKTEGVH